MEKILLRNCTKNWSQEDNWFSLQTLFGNLGYGPKWESWHERPLGTRF